jgi:hypothetical protein
VVCAIDWATYVSFCRIQFAQRQSLSGTFPQGIKAPFSIWKSAAVLSVAVYSDNGSFGWPQPWSIHQLPFHCLDLLCSLHEQFVNCTIPRATTPKCKDAYQEQLCPVSKTPFVKIGPACYYTKEMVGAHVCQPDINKSCAVSIASYKYLWHCYIWDANLATVRFPLTRRLIKATHFSTNKLPIIQIISWNVKNIFDILISSLTTVMALLSYRAKIQWREHLWIGLVMLFSNSFSIKPIPNDST